MRLALIGLLLCLVCAPGWAQQSPFGSETVSFTWQQKDALHTFPQYTVPVLKGMILHDIELTEEYARDIKREVGDEVIARPDEWIVKHFGERLVKTAVPWLEAAEACKALVSGGTIAEKVYKYHALLGNIQTLLDALLEKDHTRNKPEYKRFRNTNLLREYDEIVRNTPGAPACPAQPQPNLKPPPHSPKVQRPIQANIPPACYPFAVKQREINGAYGRRQAGCMLQLCIENGGGRFPRQIIANVSSAGSQ